MANCRQNNFSVAIQIQRMLERMMWAVFLLWFSCSLWEFSFLVMFRSMDFCSFIVLQFLFLHCRLLCMVIIEQETSKKRNICSCIPCMERFYLVLDYCTTVHFFSNLFNLIWARALFLWCYGLETGYAQWWNLVINFILRFNQHDTRYNQRTLQL